MQQHKLPEAPPFTRISSRRRSLCAAKQDSAPWKVKLVAFLPLCFYSPSVRVKANTAEAPLGIWLKNLTPAEMHLEMGSEYQQERFKRLTLVSRSMGPVTGTFQYGLLYAPYWACGCMWTSVCTQPHTVYAPTATHQKPYFTPCMSHYHFSPICDTSILLVGCKKKYDPILAFTQSPCGTRLRLKWACWLKVPWAFVRR